MEKRIRELLAAIVHPETERDLVASGFVEHVAAAADKATVVLRFAKGRDPFAVKIKKAVEEALRREFPAAEVLVVVKEGAPHRARTQDDELGGRHRPRHRHRLGQGGVGKSTVAANLAVALRNQGFRVGLLDADIYGPSQPKMFGVEGYVPDAVREEGVDRIVPADAQGIELMSIGFFIKPDDALLWRGAMAVSALKQMIHQTKWGPLDFLLSTCLPARNDIHLSIVGELKIDAAVIVSTPQQVAVADVVRGVELFRNENIAVPVAGIVENMAWFTPEELPDNRYYLFGRGGARRYAEEHGIELLGEIPLVQSIMEGPRRAARPPASIRASSATTAKSPTRW